MRRPEDTDKPWHIVVGGEKLSGPPMHPLTPPDVRVRVFECVLKRQYGLACEMAEAARAEIERGTAEQLGVKLPVHTHNRSNQHNAAA